MVRGSPLLYSSISKRQNRGISQVSYLYNVGPSLVVLPESEPVLPAHLLEHSVAHVGAVDAALGQRLGLGGGHRCKVLVLGKKFVNIVEGIGVMLP